MTRYECEVCGGALKIVPDHDRPESGDYHHGVICGCNDFPMRRVD